jgi:hypothetical protein
MQSPIDIKDAETIYDETLLAFEFINYDKVTEWTVR